MIVHLPTFYLFDLESVCLFVLFFRAKNNLLVDIPVIEGNKVTSTVFPFGDFVCFFILQTMTIQM